MGADEAERRAADDPLLKFGLLDCRPSSRRSIAATVGDPCEFGCSAVRGGMSSRRGRVRLTTKTKTGHEGRLLVDVRSSYAALRRRAATPSAPMPESINHAAAGRGTAA